VYNHNSGFNDKFAHFKSGCGYVMLFNETYITQSLYMWWGLLLLLQQVATWQELLSWRHPHRDNTNEGGGLPIL
jgi:hypothetical protein